MNGRKRTRPHGQLRLGQVVTTFGPGATLDLPNYSVLVAGLETWSLGGEDVQEPRLVAKIKNLLQLNQLSLRTPPPDTDDPTADQTGIGAWQFPEWFITQTSQPAGPGRNYRTRALVNRKALQKNIYIDDDKVKHKVVPVRFVRACRKGHIGDIDWHAFAHYNDKACRRKLWMDERGTTGDISEIYIRCECSRERCIGDAAFMEAKALLVCDGNRPWLGPHAHELCDAPNRLLVRTASNAYFPQILSVISLPDRNEDLAKAVSLKWEFFLQYVETIEQLKEERARKPPVREALKEFSDAEVFDEILARKGQGTPIAAKTVKQAEIEVLAACKESVGKDKPEGNFFARALPRSEIQTPYSASVERVVLIHRLREVVAQIGFTRFEAVAPDVDGELDANVERAAIAREISWLPAIENRGEGVFIHFSSEAIDAWLKRKSVQERGKQLLQGFGCWQQERATKNGLPARQYIGLPYIMLHSLSHMLITAVSLECGYPASSIRERIYAGQTGYGILFYTASMDAEGTLGGLVETGRQFDHHLEKALELGKLCANDPVCAQHEPANQHERRYLHGAACHGCVLIAETSCEQRNDFLDRALVVRTVENLGAEFFVTD